MCMRVKWICKESKLTWKPALVAQHDPSKPCIDAFCTFPVPTRLVSTYACQDMVFLYKTTANPLPSLAKKFKENLTKLQQLRNQDVRNSSDASCRYNAQFIQWECCVLIGYNLEFQTSQQIVCKVFLFTFTWWIYSRFYNTCFFLLARPL